MHGDFKTFSKNNPFEQKTSVNTFLDNFLKILGNF